MNQMDDKLDTLWSEYREACPDPEPGPNFMPELWRRIEARRGGRMALLYRRWTEAFVAMAVAFTILLAAFLIPQYQRAPVYEATYVDVLNAADSTFDSLADAMSAPVFDVQPGDPE